MKSQTFKKLTAMMIAVMLVFSMCVTGISASAAAVSDGTRVVYLKPNSNWTQSNARFAVYLFKGATNTWTDMSDEDGDGYYEATLPEGEWEKVIFCRMDPNNTKNNWNTKWNQTLDLDIPDDMNCYTVKEATWEKGGGEWSLYDPENPPEPPSTEATEGTTKQVITGDPDSYYLFGFINNANYGCEEDADNAGEYKFVDNQVTAKFDVNSYVAVKKGDNSAWYMTEGWLGESVTSALLKNTNDIASGANKLFVPGGVEVTFTLVDNGDDTFTLSYASATDPTGTTDPTEVTEPTEPVPVDYYLFGSINGANYGCEEDYANMGEYKFVDGKLTVEFTEMSYVGVKTTDNGAWYMTDDWQGVVNEVTLYNAANLGETANKLVVPAGVVNFTLVVNDDGTLTLSYESDVAPTIPTEAPTDPTEPVAVDYYLFGSINGANYGCEEDYANMGDYKFVDGKLTVEFTEMSYVGVKTTDNGAWYMTDDWQGVVNEVTLYNAANLGETANKLVVPAGVVNFTLVVNDDDTLTLSYESDVVPTIPTEAPTTEPVTEPTTEPVTEPTTEPAKNVTIYFAAPRVAPGRTVWSDVDIYYNNTTSVIKSNRIHMTDTGLVIDNPAGANLKTTRRGNWHVFSAELTADQVNAIDSATYSGFVYAGNYNLKTSAKFDIKMGGSIADFDGQVFLINGAVTNSEVDSYTGAWTTEKPFKPEYKATRLRFACPTQNWSGGVYFYYGDSSVITTVTKLEMTPSGQTYTVNDSLVSALTKYVGGDWEVYTLELTAEQVEIIDNSSVSGFCSGSSIYVKTSSARNVFRDYNSVSDLANYTFVATNCTNAAQERASLTGKWRWCTI